MNSTQNKTEALEKLYSLAMNEGDRDRDFESDRERSGSYVSGFKKATTTATLTRGPYEIVAKKVEYTSFSTSSDFERTTYYLVITSDGEVVCQASRDGRQKIDRFSAPDEMFQGSKITNPGNWEITSGDLPAQLLNI